MKEEIHGLSKSGGKFMFLKKNLPILLFFSILIMSCGDDPVSNTSSVSGRFVSEDGKAIDGALVRVFAVKPLDTLVMRLRRDYKDVGCDISDATEFDHRFYGKPLAEGKTNTNGEFSLGGINGGVYHISITHPKYSWRYIYQSNGTLGEIRTRPIKELKGLLLGDQIWEESGQDYVITGNTTISGNSLTIKKGVRIRLGNQRKLTILNGSVGIEGSINMPVWVTSDTDSSDKNYSGGLDINNSRVSLNYSSFSGANNPLQVLNCKGTIASVFCENGNNGIQLSGCDSSLQIANIIARNSINSGIRTESTAMSLKNIISYQNQASGGEFTQGSQIFIENSFLNGSQNGLKVIGHSTAEVDHCECIASGEGVLLVASYGIINHSNLSGNHALSVQDISSGGGSGHNSDLKSVNLYAKNTNIALFRAPSKNNFNDSYFDGCATIAEILLRLPIDYSDLNGGYIASRQVNSPVFTTITTAGLKK